MSQQHTSRPPTSPTPSRAGEWELIGEPLAEAAVLGCLLRTTAAHARQVLAGLANSDWSVPQHAHVAAAVRVLLEQNVPVDPVTVLGQLRRQGIEGATTACTDAGVLLLELCAAAPSVASATYYARIVREHSYRRRVQQAGLRLLAAASRADLDDLQELVEDEHAALDAQHTRTHTS